MLVKEGEFCEGGKVIAQIEGSLATLLTGERVALNLAMRLSGIATLTRKYVEKIEDLPTLFVDTRKTTPGLRILEKYATQVGGAINHRMGLDDAGMIVETENLEQVKEALEYQADIIMLDNMKLDMMRQAVEVIRQHNNRVKIEASGNVTLETIRAIAETGVDYISSSAPITQSKWLDLSMKID